MARPDTRGALLDTAERLFAQHGIATVSDRKIAEEAGSSNKSAVAYYFEDRRGLLRAMIDRHVVALEPRRRDLLDRSDTLLGDVRALVLPAVEVFAALPTPSWRARFLNQAAHDPAASELLRQSADSAPAAARVFSSIVARLDPLPRDVLVARAGLMTYLLATACAQAEQRFERERGVAEWSELGHVLGDALAGMLQAPVTPMPDRER